MRFIEQNFEFIEQNNTLIGIAKHVEKAARVCYKSEGNITEDSFKVLLNNLLKKKHYSPFAHGTVYLYCSPYENIEVYNNVDFYTKNKFTKVRKIQVHKDNKHYVEYYITTNLRVIVENLLVDDLNYICEPTEHHYKRTTVKIQTSIGVTRELNRHSVVLSICEQSTRYCNYNKDKFGNEITFVIPHWVKYDWYDDNFGIPFNNEEPIVRPAEDSVEAIRHYHYFYGLKYSEEHYLKLIELGVLPQDARGVLNLDVATEVYYTAFDDDWCELFDKRTTSACHPNVLKLMKPLQKQFKKLNKI